MLVHEDAMVRIFRTRRPAGIRVVGEVDMSNAPVLGTALESSRRGQYLTVDLSECTHLGSGGIGSIIEVWQRHQGELELRIEGASPTIAYALEVSGITRFPGIQLVRASKETG
jgi:anti-anti-sigma factor